MILDDVFQFLKAEGLTRSHATFSTDYLGHSPRYYDYLRCSGAPPSLCSLLKIGMCLHDMAQDTARCVDQFAAATLARKAMSCALSRCR